MAVAGAVMELKARVGLGLQGNFSSSAGLSGMSRPPPPLPRSTRIIMRRLSTSLTFSSDTSIRRKCKPLDTA